MGTKKILITGGLGFIGMNVAKLLVEQGRQVVLFDNLSPQIHGAIPDLSSLPLLRSGDVEVVRGNVCRHEDWEALLADVGCVVHLAAETGTAQSMYEISRYTDTNVGGTASLLNHLANNKHKVNKIVLASSRSVYGEGAYWCERCGEVFPSARSAEMLRRHQWQPECPSCAGDIGAAATREDAKTAPASIYAATKLAQEDLVRIAGKALGIPTVIFRLQNVYGEGQSLKNPYTGILSIFSNQIRQGKIVNLYEDGQESRDFVHVSDVARAIVLGITSDRADGNTLNVGYGKPTSVERIAILLGELLGAAEQPIVSGQYRVGDIRHGFADTSVIYDQLGFIPETSLEQGLERFVSWVRRQPMEEDRLDAATEELLSRRLMEKHVEVQAAAL